MAVLTLVIEEITIEKFSQLIFAVVRIKTGIGKNGISLAEIAQVLDDSKIVYSYESDDLEAALQMLIDNGIISCENTGVKRLLKIK